MWGTRFPVSGSGSSTDQFWAVNFIEDGPVNLPADFAGAVVDAESGLVVNSFFQISVPKVQSERPSEEMMALRTQRLEPFLV